jgi:hypothetical protein
MRADTGDGGIVYSPVARGVHRTRVSVSKGRSREKKMKRGYIWQMANKSGRYLSVFFFFNF